MMAKIQGRDKDGLDRDGGSGSVGGGWIHFEVNQ